MQERISLIQHRGKGIVFLDYSNMTPPEVIDLTRLVPEALKAISGDLIVLVDATNTRGSLESMRALKDLLASTKRGRLKKAACIGASGLGTVLLDGLSRVSPVPIKAFASKDAALDWLAE